MAGQRIGLKGGAAIAALFLSLCGARVYMGLFGGLDVSLSNITKTGAPFHLTDHHGKPISEKALDGQPTAVFFGFTHCPEVCPTSLYELASLLKDLGDEGKNIGAFFFTLDPERDTPLVMKSYVENFTDRITGITGDPDRMAALAKAWHVYWKKVPLDDGDYTMDHTASIFLIDGSGRFKGTIAYGESPDTARAKLRRLANG